MPCTYFQNREVHVVLGDVTNSQPNNLTKNLWELLVGCWKFDVLEVDTTIVSPSNGVHYTHINSIE